MTLTIKPIKVNMVPNCYRCLHYFVTWEGNYPHGCRAMGFKSRQLPMIDVRRTMHGQICLAFEQRKKIPSKSNKNA